MISAAPALPVAGARACLVAMTDDVTKTLTDEEVHAAIYAAAEKLFYLEARTARGQRALEASWKALANISSAFLVITDRAHGIDDDADAT